MISNIAQINTFTRGLDLDDDVTVIPNNRYRYAENIKVLTNDNGTTTVLQNLDGIYKYITSSNDFTENKDVIIGCTAINDIVVVITQEQSQEDRSEEPPKVDRSDALNKIFRITGFNTPRPQTDLVCKGKLGICPVEGDRLCITGVYENSENIKIYFTDGRSQMKVINLLETKYKGKNNYFLDNAGNIKNPGALDYIPEAQLDPFTLKSVTGGSLPAGMVWYCYQLFNEFGSASKLSPISTSFHLCGSSSNQSTVKYMGSFEGDNSGKGVVMSTKLHVHDFDYCRVYRIISTSNNQLPKIYIIDEVPIKNVIDTFTYVDRGSSILSEISVEEFNNLNNAQFRAKTLCTKDNRLFAANVTDETWDCGDYDARAYRANTNGQIQINDASNVSQSFNLNGSDEGKIEKVAKTHDCINPYNLQREYNSKDTTNQYVYGKNNTLGGYGPNIEYTFITTDLHLTNKQKQNDGLADRDNYNDVSSEYLDKFKVYEWQNASSNGSWKEETNVNLGSLNDDSLGSRQHNYADPEVDALLQGYQRDEIYRFGIVFYNKKSIPSPVYWIGDIRIPHAAQIPPYEYKENRMIAHPLGIKFKVKKVPEGAIAYEIVRCDRTQADRTVIIQCAATNVYQYKIQEQGESVGHGTADDSSLELRPFIIPDFCKTAKMTVGETVGRKGAQTILDKSTGNQNSDATPSEYYLRLISPEICIQEEASEDLFKDGVYLDYFQTFASLINIDAGKKSSIAVGISGSAAVPTVIENNTVKFSFANTNNKLLAPEEIETDADTDIFPIVHTMKYYQSFYDDSIVSQSGSNVAKPLTIIDAEYPLMIPYNAFQDVSAYKINVGSNTYTNYAHTQFKSTDKRTAVGQAGPCVIVQLENNSNTYKSLNRYDVSQSTLNSKRANGSNTVNIDKEHLATAIPYFNLKKANDAQYGGNTYGSRQNSVYISIGAYHRVDECKETNGEHISYTFGGDTYMGMIDYPFTMVFQGNDIKTESSNKIFVNAYLPFESSINMNLLMGDTFSNTRSVYMQMTPIQMGSYHIQDRPYYAYNPVYSAQQSAMIFTPEAVHKSSNVHGNRIYASQAKTNGEVIDNWTQFRVADYLDVDSSYGDITNLRNFQDRLYFWQRDAFGIATTNERSLITDDNSNQLALGTGTLLSRFDYITNKYGDDVLNDKSIIQTPAKLYWFDKPRNELIGFDGQPHSMGKELQVQSYLNDLEAKYKTDVISTYDYKYNEVWFNFNNEKTLVYSELLNVFTSFYTYKYDWALVLSDRTMLIKDGKFHLVNEKMNDMEKTETHSKIEIVVNQDYPYTKVFDNVRFQGNFTDKSNKELKDKIFEAISFYTKNQSAVLKQDVNGSKPVLDYREDTYRFALPRAKYEKPETEPVLSLAPRLRGKWLRCVYEFSKTDGDTFELPQITTTFRKSLI